MSPRSWKWMFALLAFAATAAFTSAKGSPRSDNDEAKVREAATQSTKAAEAFDAIMGAPDKAIPQDLLARAKAIAVFPRVIKAAFLVGGEGGRGCVSRRTKAG